MQRTPVSSSDIQSIGYDPGSRTLEIEFHSGGVYQYYDVPETVQRNLIGASFHGQYFHAHTKDRFRYQRIS